MLPKENDNVAQCIHHHARQVVGLCSALVIAIGPVLIVAVGYAEILGNSREVKIGVLAQREPG